MKQKGQKPDRVKIAGTYVSRWSKEEGNREARKRKETESRRGSTPAGASSSSDRDQ